MNNIVSKKNEIIFENTHTRITVSTKDAKVTSAIRLDANESYLSSEESFFFTLF